MEPFVYEPSVSGGVARDHVGSLGLARDTFAYSFMQANYFELLYCCFNQKAHKLQYVALQSWKCTNKKMYGKKMAFFGHCNFFLFAVPHRVFSLLCLLSFLISLSTSFQVSLWREIYKKIYSIWGEINKLKIPKQKGTKERRKKLLHSIFKYAYNGNDFRMFT